MGRHRFLVLPALAATVLIAACGGGSSPVASRTTTTASPAQTPAAASDLTTTTTSTSTSVQSTASTALTGSTTTTTARSATVNTASPKIARATPAFATATTTSSTVADASGTTVPPPAPTGTITVFAAASLTAAFTDIGKAFHAANPSADVRFNFAASSTLVTQINQGAPADVFASADDANMKKLTDAGNNLGNPIEFATNKLQVIVPKSNPRNVTSVTDLAKSNVVTVTCDPSVPIGAYTQQVFQKANITVKPKSLEPDVKGIVSKVLAGEADAGVVYATDVLAAGSGAQGVVIPDEWNVIANYPISVVRETHDAYSAQVFMNYVLSSDGQSILAKYGFTAP